MSMLANCAFDSAAHQDVGDPPPTPQRSNLNGIKLGSRNLTPCTLAQTSYGECVIAGGLGNLVLIFSYANAVKPSS